ncbi:MAG: DUF4124 domain-containing protein [Burkholderiales bacterium]
MKNSANLLIYAGLCCAALPLAARAEIYKCNSDNSIVYQDVPCKPGQTAMDVAVIPIRLLEPNSVSPLNLRQDPLPPSQLQSTALALGMSDTEVLNMRGWGRPSKIHRSRVKNTWHEEWIYGPPDEPKQQLEFANGKLAAIQ